MAVSEHREREGRRKRLVSREPDKTQARRTPAGNSQLPLPIIIFGTAVLRETTIGAGLCV